MTTYDRLEIPPERALERVRAEAFSALTPGPPTPPPPPRGPGSPPGPGRPPRHGAGVPEDAVLVFEDQMPGANFGHPCRYLFHSPKDGSLLHTVEAMFPPEVADIALLPQYFHEPLAQPETRPNIYAKVDWSKVARYPWLVDDNRFALLWTSQISNRRHVEDTEFAYRILRHKFGFPASKIYVLCYDGTIDSTDFHGAEHGHLGRRRYRLPDAGHWVGDEGASAVDPDHDQQSHERRQPAVRPHQQPRFAVRSVRGQLRGRHAHRVVDDARWHEVIRNPGGDDGAVLLGCVPAADARPQQGEPYLVRERGARRQGQCGRLALRPVGPHLVRGRQRSDRVRCEPGAQPRRQRRRTGQRQGGLHLLGHL